MMLSVKESFFSYTNSSSTYRTHEDGNFSSNIEIVLLNFGFENENVGGGRKRVWISPCS